MSNNKSRSLERKAGGWKVFSGNDLAGDNFQKGAVPQYLMSALRQCVEKRTLSPRTIETNEQLGAFLTRLVKRPSIGIEFGLDLREIEELVSLWNRLTDNGARPPSEVLLPPKPSLRKPPKFDDDLQRRIWERMMKEANYL